MWQSHTRYSFYFLLFIWSDDLRIGISSSHAVNIQLGWSELAFCSLVLVLARCCKIITQVEERVNGTLWEAARGSWAKHLVLTSIASLFSNYLLEARRCCVYWFFQSVLELSYIRSKHRGACAEAHGWLIEARGLIGKSHLRRAILVEDAQVLLDRSFVVLRHPVRRTLLLAW